MKLPFRINLILVLGANLENPSKLNKHRYVSIEWQTDYTGNWINLHKLLEMISIDGGF